MGDSGSNGRDRAWFVPKSHGYGATPSTWEGWALVAGFVAVIAAAGWLVLARAPEGGPGLGRIAVFFAIVAVLALALSWLARSRTDGEWRWRWGGKDRD
jgi:hypothetical protein